MCGWLLVIGIILAIIALAACVASGKADDDMARYMEEWRNEH